MSSLASNEELINQRGNLIDGSYEEGMQQKWFMYLQEFQQLHSHLVKAQREVASLEQRLYHARRNLEEEKRKRRAVEQQRDLLDSQINMTREILFHNEEANLDEEIKKKLQFLNTFIIMNKQNNLSRNNNRDIQSDGQLNTIVEMNSTGSILSDLNCLSKSEEDFDTNFILIQNQKQREWKEHKPSGEYFINKQCSTLDKVAEFNSTDRVITTTVKSNNGTHTSQTQVASNNENIGSKMRNAETFASHSFISKMVIKPETCTPCGKRIRFGKTILKCRNCSFACHVECKTTILHPYGKTLLCDSATK